MIAASGVGMPALREARMPSHASSAAIRSSTAPTISAEAQSGTAVARPAIAPASNASSASSANAAATAMSAAAFACVLTFSVTSVLASSISALDDGRDVVAQPANQILNPVGRKHEA